MVYAPATNQASVFESGKPALKEKGVTFIRMENDRSVFRIDSGNYHFEALRAINVRYPIAAATTVMDLTVEAEAFGAFVIFSEHEIPTVKGSIVKDLASIQELRIPSLTDQRLPQYLEASRLAALHIDKPVLSGCIGPFSLAGRLFDMTEIMTACYLEPETVHLLLQKCTDFLLTWCTALKATGTLALGNLGPVRVIKSATSTEVYDKTLALLKATASNPNFILSSGCNNPPGTPLANIDAFFKALEDFNSEK